MHPYSIIKILKQIGFIDDRGEVYSIPRYHMSLKKDNGMYYYMFYHDNKGGWSIRKSGPDMITYSTDKVSKFIGEEFGEEYIRDYNITKILK